MRTVVDIAAKDLLLRWRDRLGFFWWMVGFPLLIAVLIGTIFSGVLDGPTKPLRVAIVDETGSEASRQFVAMLEQWGGARLERRTLESARDAVRRGELPAFVLLRKGFRISPQHLLGEPLPLAVGIDPLRRAELSYLQAGLYGAAAEVLRQRWLDPARRSGLIEEYLAFGRGSAPAGGLQRATIDAALAVIDPMLRTHRDRTATQPAGQLVSMEVISLEAERAIPISSFEVCFPLGISWGLLGLAAEFAIAFVQERQNGTLLRLRVAPIRLGTILAGNGIACFVSSVALVIFLLIVGRLAFGVRLQNPLSLAMAIVAIGACFVGLTMLLSVLGKTESAVGGGAWAVLLVMAMLGGGMVPQIFMPSWMETASNLSPVKWAILGLEGGIWRGLSPSEMIRPCAILLAQGTVAGMAGVLILTRTDR